jgi:hypothetical protein
MQSFGILWYPMASCGILWHPMPSYDVASYVCQALPPGSPPASPARAVGFNTPPRKPRPLSPTPGSPEHSDNTPSSGLSPASGRLAARLLLEEEVFSEWTESGDNAANLLVGA